MKSTNDSSARGHVFQIPGRFDIYLSSKGFPFPQNSGLVSSCMHALILNFFHYFAI